MELNDLRRQNALEVMKENALDEVGFALCLGVDESQLAAMLTSGSRKKISDALARQIEQTFSKPAMWMDVDVNNDASSGPSFDLFG